MASITECKKNIVKLEKLKNDLSSVSSSGEVLKKVLTNINSSLQDVKIGNKPCDDDYTAKSASFIGDVQQVCSEIKSKCDKKIKELEEEIERLNKIELTKKEEKNIDNRDTNMFTNDKKLKNMFAKID